MTYGTPGRGKHDWTLGEEASRPLIKAAVEAGVNFFDTADSYSDGTSEEIVGRALKEFARRDEVVIATKVCRRVRPGPNGAGLSRKAILSGIDGSLKRLGTDHVDLYQIHRWDDKTPIEETLEALNDVVRMGKALYIGASAMYAWQFMKALSISRINAWSEFVSMQNHLNLLAREEEREMLPLCADQKIAVIPFSPLARGRLTRAWDQSSQRQIADSAAVKRYERQYDVGSEIVKRLTKIADDRGIPRAQVALAWLLEKPQVTAPIIGVAKLAHLIDAVSALSVKLDREEVRLLEEPYLPQGAPSFE
jgi:aryl-alcohol dehydrogenase-like predicted oxidoreductase